MDSDKLRSLFDLSGRVAVITGGTRGIGWAIAETFATAGAAVVVTGRKAESVAAAAERLRQAGSTALGVPAHMGDLDAISDLVELTARTYGRIDIIVNNAGISIGQPIGGLTTEAWSKSYDVNVRGPVFLVQAALSHLKASPAASVINVLTAGAFLSSPGLGTYTATKAALLAYTRSMAAELAPHAIRVNALAPGTVDTDMVRNTRPEDQERMARASLLRRLAHPDEIAGPALLLASDAGSYLTGQLIITDGGLVVPR